MIAIYDYLSMTFSGYSSSEIKTLLGLTEYNWEPATGARGYAQGEYFQSIKIFSCPHPSNRFNVWLEMSGSACRSFETYGNANYQALFRLLNDDFENVHLTRLDIAFDDYTIDPRDGIDEFREGGVLDIDKISSLVLDVNSDGTNDHYICKSKYWNVERSSKGTTVYFGSPSSLIRFRIYDKARERNFENLHWVRFECQLRDDRARLFAIKSLFGEALGFSFSDLINNYLRFIDNDDCNKSRCSTSDWWQCFIDTTNKLSVFEKPGSDYNLGHLYNLTTHTWGNAIYTMVQAIGLDEFIDGVNKNRSPVLPVKYATLLEQQKILKEQNSNENV